jgi:signal transduction histidine kinase/CheY-like chemotaxis protein
MEHLNISSYWDNTHKRNTTKAESDRNLNLHLLTQEIFQTVGWEYDLCRKWLVFTRPLKNILLHQNTPKNLKEFALCFEEGEFIEAGLALALASGQKLDIEIREKGSDQWFRLVVSPVLQRRRVVSLRGAIMNISDRKQTEKDLSRAVIKAEEVASLKQQFLANMSHEIRSPISAVIGIAHLLLQEKPRGDQLENLETLKFLGDNLLVLVNDTLDYCKIESGKIIFEYIDFDLTELLVNIKRVHIQKAQQKGITFTLCMNPDLPKLVKGDPYRLTQVLNNLISNAIKFTKKGSVEVAVDLLNTTEQSAEVAFAVRDTGIGIDASMQNNIFDSFTQAGADTVRHFGGTGLGLTITKKLLELQGSSIHVESKPNQGSNFQFSLKFGQHREHIETDPSNQNKPSHFKSLAGYRVLVVDDQKINSTVATKIMKKWNLDIDIAENGAEAFEKITTTFYDLILMDLHMPVMDGYASSEQIRTLPQERFKKLPIIALTASDRNDIKQHVFNAGITDYISKPYTAHELYDKIVRYLG